MKGLTDCFTLSNGVKIPCIGYGTWQTPDGEVATCAVKAALAAGYRHIDNAEAYHNAVSVGRAIQESDVPREEIFITSKLMNAVRGYQETKDSFYKTLVDLGVDYLDLYLIHWPNPVKYRDHWKELNAQSWRAIEELYEEGKVRAIGVSNFQPRHFDALLETAKIVPMVNQIKLCPGEVQPAAVEYCRKNNILLEAYSPLGTGKLLGLPEVTALAEKYNKTPAQICIRWSMQCGFLPLPKSVTPQRIEENADVFGFEIAQEDLELLASLDGPCKAFNPDEVNF